MDTVKMSSKGQLVIPKDVRDEHHLAAGMEFLVQFVGDEIRLKPLPLFPPTTVAQGARLLEKPKRRRMPEEETQQAIGRLIRDADKASKA